MDFTCIHIFGHILSEDIIKSIETDNSLFGNRESDFAIEGHSVNKEIDYVWSGVRRDWDYCMKDRNFTNDPYGTKSVRKFMRSFLTSLGYVLEEQKSSITVGSKSFNITAICPGCEDLPFIIEGDRINETSSIATSDKCSLDYRAKGERQQKSPHAKMLEYLNATENIYGIVTNGKIIRVIRNSGQLVKLTYLEFDLEKIIEEDHYSEFVILFRLLHASRFAKRGEDSIIFEQYFNQSIESGNRIRAGLSNAVELAMRNIGEAAFNENTFLQEAYSAGEVKPVEIHKELIHLIYKLLFLFIIEDRHLIYDDSLSDEDAAKLQIYSRFYSAGRFRNLSEFKDVKKKEYHDLWESLFETFRLFEDEDFGAKLCIKPLGGELFAKDSTPWLRKCSIDNKTLLDAFSCLNEFKDENGNWVKINYTALDVEEFGSVYEGILELEAYVTPGYGTTDWIYDFTNGGDRKSTSSYYTRPDLVNNLVKSTLVPVIEEKLKALSTTEEKEKMLLDLKVCDAASGSGHIVLAMARTIAWYLSIVRSGEDNPASKDYREALREVIQKCIYAVDFNPDAVELCKLVLWIEGYCTGKPLTFLDHHVRCGNSVVGVTDLTVLQNEIPVDAFTAEDKEALKFIKKLNSDEAAKAKGKVITLFGDNEISVTDEQLDIASTAKAIAAMPEDTLEQELKKESKWAAFMNSSKVVCLKRACDIYTWAFYKKYRAEEIEDKFEYEIPCPSTISRALNEIDNSDSGKKPLTDEFRNNADSIADNYKFFHWSVEFPDVFAAGGFDVMCGNPPWDKIKVEDKKWFEKQGRMDIVNAGSAAIRKKLVAALPVSDPELYERYRQALEDAEAMSRFVRFSGRFPLTATGDIDLYPLFAELCLSFSKDAWGLVLPTGIAINDSNKAFFGKLIDENRLMSLYDFENREGLFDIHRMFKFCLLTAGKESDKPKDIKGGFYLTKIEHLVDPRRIYTIKSNEFASLNPNTKTCPVFRSSKDAELTTKIYKSSTILLQENPLRNPWHVQFQGMLHMSNDSHLFRTYNELISSGGIFKNGRFIVDDDSYVPLYEGKMIWHYNHHFATWPSEGERPNSIPEVSVEDLQKTDSYTLPWFWIKESDVKQRLIKSNGAGEVIWEWTHKWLLCYRCIARSVDQRTFICSFVPDTTGVGNSATMIYPGYGVIAAALLQTMMTSLVFDYAVRQKVGGINMNTFFVKQFPVLLQDSFHENDKRFILERAFELNFFNYDLQGWADEIWEEADDELKDAIINRFEECNGATVSDKATWKPEPCIFNPERRAIAQAELDAIYAHLYGLNTEDLKYILDPEDVFGEGCINETFRVLKDREIRELGEYRTKRLVLEAWHKFGFEK